MIDHAKKVIELQRRIQQAFFTIQEFCDPKKLLNRKRIGNNAELMLERTVEDLSTEVDEIKVVKVEDNQMDVFSTEVGIVKQSSARLNAILHLMNVTKTLRRMKDKDEALILIRNSEQEFNKMSERYPFEKEDIESRTAHIIYCLFIAEATNFEPIKPLTSETALPLKRYHKLELKIDRQCAESEANARRVIDAATYSLHPVGEIEQHDISSTEKVLEDLKHAQKIDGERAFVASPHEWLASLKLEKCKVSNRARKILQYLIELIDSSSNQPTNHAITRSIAAIIQMFTVRAQPTNQCDVDSAVFFNDCLFLAVEIERAKCKNACSSEGKTPIDAFNLGSLLAILRKTGRNTLIRDVIAIKRNYLTWPEDALAKYLDRSANHFGNVLIQLQCFSDLWLDVCSKNTYAWLVFLAASHVLNLLADTMDKLPNFERSTCSRVLPLFNEITDKCGTHIQGVESSLKIKYADTKPGQLVAKKIAYFKQQMISNGADRSLAELFDFKIAV